jgi:Na+/phosphate symporter
MIVVTPPEDTPILHLLLDSITTDPLIAASLAAVLTWAAHSSVAVVLLVMSFAANGAIPSHAAFALVLGANLGTSINPLLEAPSGGDPAARRLPVGNILSRLLGCVAALFLVDQIGPFVARLEPDPARALADFHTAFNLLLALVFLPVLGPGHVCSAGSCRHASSLSTHLAPSTLTRPPARVQPSGSPALRARRSAWRMFSRLCSAVPSMVSMAETGGALRKPNSWTMYSTASTERLPPT